MTRSGCIGIVTQVAVALLATTAAMAADVSFTGFASFTGGKVLSGNGQNSSLGASYQCPCYLANYEYAGVYQKTGWTATPESLAALQANIRIDNQLSATVQVDGRDVDGFKAAVDWAYLSYVWDANWTFQAGHKRIPMYYYADSNYVGYSYTWVRPPVDIYGWDVYAYNGANALFKHRFSSDWTLLWNTWAGSEDTTNNAYWTKLYNGGVTTTSNWHNIIGTYADLSNDIYDFRLIYMQNSISVAGFSAPGVPVSTGEDGTPYRQRVFGAAFTMDYGNWLWRSEFNNVKRTAPFAAPSAPAWLAALGYRFGDWTAMATYSRYWEQATSIYMPQRDDTRTVTLRWDFHPSVALKFQYDWIKDHSPTATGGTGAYFGDAKLATVSLVTTF